jgi:hypothetical protein
MRLESNIYEQYDRAMIIDNQEEADQYFELLVAYMMGAIVAREEEVNNVRDEAELRTRINLGYFAGNYPGQQVQSASTYFQDDSYWSAVCDLLLKILMMHVEWEKQMSNEPIINITTVPDVELVETLSKAMAVLTVASFGANINRKTKSNERTVWAKLDTPPNRVLRIAIPLHAGAGPQPEKTITTTELRDMISNIVSSLEWVLDDAEVVKDVVDHTKAGW